MRSIEDLVNSKGLVLMRVTQPFAPYQAGALAGFPPGVAADLIKQRAAVPVDTSGEVIEDVGTHTPIRVERDPRDDINIPADWESLHHLQQIKLAKLVAGSNGEMDKEQARNILSSEMKRRSSNGIQVREPVGGAGAPA